MNLFLYYSGSYNPWFNLSIEKMLMDSVDSDSVILYIWQNQNTVVIGKSQNAWKECRVSLLESEGGKLARRTTGGGAVFHDLGNLCYSFIASKNLYNLEKQLSVILEAVRKVGIEAHFTGRNDIVSEDGRKFSGNAFCHTQKAGLMHGTLLVDTDPGKLQRYLQVSPVKMISKGISSVRSRVVNLKEINPDINTDTVSKALSEAFSEVYGALSAPPVTFLPEITDSKINLKPVFSENIDFPEIYAYFSSWEMRFGENYSFELSYEKKFPWGLISVSMNTDHGVITFSKIETDAMDGELSFAVESALNGSPLSLPVLSGKIRDALQIIADTKKENTAADMAAVSDDIIGMIKEML